MANYPSMMVGYKPPSNPKPVPKQIITENDTLIPGRVITALKYVKMCNEVMGYQYYTCNGTDEVHDRELHPKQEACFNLACDLLGDYFTGDAYYQGEQLPKRKIRNERKLREQNRTFKTKAKICAPKEERPAEG